MAKQPNQTEAIRHQKDDVAHRAGMSDQARWQGDHPESLVALCCRAVERDGYGPCAASALGERHRWMEVRVEALGPLARAWPRLGRPAAWDLTWYRPECADLLGQVHAIDRTDAQIFPARNRGTMRDWIYAHADGRAAVRLPDAHPYTETLLRREVDAHRYSPPVQGGHGGWTVPHACSLSIPARLVLPDDVACLVQRLGGPRQNPKTTVASIGFVEQPYPLMTHRPSILGDTLSWPPACGMPVAPAYPFDHVVVARWRRGGMHGLVCVNANPDAAAADYGLVCSIYLGAETAYVPHRASLGDLMRAFEATRSTSPRRPPGTCDDAMKVDRFEGCAIAIHNDHGTDNGQHVGDQPHHCGSNASAATNVAAMHERTNPIVAAEDDKTDDFFLWLMRRQSRPYAPPSGAVAATRT
ncbi:hypothetical protein pqer_cds_412 [Pandoravirus quercus]|uniref:Uncharacterized protein n=1 Tax=Pandoravirus quercus TaxID=2107709 RepID=A0A2U7U8R8_9VIRU|nr:hypothetical protein pqer_cds_412 [Pandoravirus quercus]AVK74834.1 hypothetical protein pqer_cds_412 [Pandoravirus quercus]